MTELKGAGLAAQDLWVSGEGGYHTYRIPALCVTTKGTMLAFCEGRKHSRHDAEEIDMLLRRSLDGGRTWEETQVIVTDPGMTCGNPAPVVDRDTGTTWLPFNKNQAYCTMEDLRTGVAARTVWLTHSNDDGATWSEPVEISESVKRPDWTWYATGPCHSIQLESGRLLVPCDHRVRADTVKDENRYSHVIYSDDHGATWQIGGIVKVEGTNECAAVETVDGAVHLNCRDQAKRGRRVVAWSYDGGQTFAEAAFEDVLIEPACQGTVARLTTERQHGKDRLLMCNPASRTRDTLTVRLSYDEGRTWARSKVLDADPTAYSDLAVTYNDGGEPSIWCLYERGEQPPPYDRLTLARFDLPWLTDGEDRTV